MNLYYMTLGAATLPVLGWAVVAWTSQLRRQLKEDATDPHALEMEQLREEQPPAGARDNITDNLLMFFQLSNVSRNILLILGSGAQLSHGKLAKLVNASLVRAGALPLSEQAIRARVMNLMGASLAQLRDGELSVTNAGREVLARLRSAYSAS
jgi:hypothetical protein